MALSTEEKELITKGIENHWSSIWESCAIGRQDLVAAIDATDNWIDDNQTSYNSSLPSAAQSGLTATQKTLLFCAVALARVSISFLRRVFGGI